MSALGSNAEAEGPEGFTPENLDKTVLAMPLIRRLKDDEAKPELDEAGNPKKWDLVLDLNLEFAADREKARAKARTIIKQAITKRGKDKAGQGIGEAKSGTSQYVFAALERDVIRDVVDRNKAAGRPIFRIWPDFVISRL